jgi:hypothetical protein
VDAANLSHFDRIVVMPTSAAPRPAAGAAPAPPAFAQPQFAVPADDEEDDQPAPNMPSVVPKRGPVFNTPQQPQMVNPPFGPNGVPFDPNGEARGGGPRGAAGQPVAEPPASSQPAAPGTFPRAPSSSGVAVPGMIVPSPQPAPGAQPASTGRGGGPGGP